MKRRKARKFWFINDISGYLVFERKESAEGFKSWACLGEPIIHVQEVLPRRKRKKVKK